MGSLFDGIGGFPLAAVRNGIKPLWASEIEPFPIEVTKTHFPDMVHVGDITKLKGADLPPVDIICGGSPCQDCSVASGTRAGLQGARSGLFFEQIRITKELRDADILRGRSGQSVRPRYFCWENVMGVFSSGTPHGEDFRIVLESIARLHCPTVSIPRPYPWGWKPAGAIRMGDAFSLAWRGFFAEYWTLAQRRHRILLVADLGGSSAEKYYLTTAACLGILRRAKERGKPLPQALDTALQIQAGLIGLPESRGETVLLDAAAAFAQPGMRQQTFAASFSAGASATAGTIGYAEEVAPTLKGSPSGNCMPSVLCVNDQGGQRIDLSEDVSGTLRASEKGHQPLVYENHGIDARVRESGEISPTVTARFGTGGGNTPLVQEPNEVYCIVGNIIDRQPENGGNGCGYQENLAYTITTCDRLAVYARQRVDEFRNDDIASTQSARQAKDATDLVMEPDRQYARLIRRLTPGECELLQGFLPGWTDIPSASDSARYRALGNSVPVPCVEFIMKSLQAVAAMEADVMQSQVQGEHHAEE